MNEPEPTPAASNKPFFISLGIFGAVLGFSLYVWEPASAQKRRPSSPSRTDSEPTNAPRTPKHYSGPRTV